MRDVKLPSGATMSVAPSPFGVSKALYQALLRELKTLVIRSDAMQADLYKDIFCLGFSSPVIEACIEECLKKCLYNGARFDSNTFEPLAARDDYMKVCVEVVKENTLPFVKSLYAEYQLITGMIENIRK